MNGSLIQTRRSAFEDSDGHAYLLIILGSSYVEWMKYMMGKEEAVCFYMFARIFERSEINGETGIHKHIVKLIIDEDQVPLPDASGYKGFPVSAKLDCNLDVYRRLRRMGRPGRADSFPKFEVLES